MAQNCNRGSNFLLVPTLGMLITIDEYLLLYSVLNKEQATIRQIGSNLLYKRRASGLAAPIPRMHGAGRKSGANQAELGIGGLFRRNA